MQALALLLLLQVPAGVPIKDWKIQRREPSPKTGQQEIVAFIEGDEALPVSTERTKEIFDIKGLRLRYYTDPRKPADPSEEVRLSSDTARIDNVKDRVDLAGHVHIEKPQEGTTLDTAAAILYFHKRYLCPEHDTTSPEPGKCPVCKATLKPKTFASIETPGSFTLARIEPRTTITGEGLTGTDDLRQMKIARDGHLLTSGTPRELAPGAPPPSPAASKPVETEMASAGPMTFVESPAGIVVTAEKRVRVRRTEALADDRLETTTVTADEAELAARRLEGDKKAGPAPQRLTARGAVTMESREATARGDRLTWDRSGDGEDLTRLEGERASVDSAGNHVEARFVTLDRISGVATFREQVAATVAPGKQQPDAPPLRIRCRFLETRMAPETREFSSLSATDDVLLEGLGQGPDAKPGSAEADRFTWDPVENHGLLEKRPFVRVTQEGSIILAPRIVLEGRSTVILKGPKLLVLVSRDAAGAETRTSVTSDSDILLDSSDEKKTVIRLRDRCTVRTPDVHLFADRMTVLAPKGGQGIESLSASGHVRALQLKESATMIGEWLTFRPKTDVAPQTLTLTGMPKTTIDTGRTVATQAQVLVYEKVDPATGRKMTYQEMKGGRVGVTIVMDEK